MKVMFKLDLDTVDAELTSSSHARRLSNAGDTYPPCPQYRRQNIGRVKPIESGGGQPNIYAKSNYILNGTLRSLSSPLNCAQWVSDKCRVRSLSPRQVASNRTNRLMQSLLLKATQVHCLSIQHAKAVKTPLPKNLSSRETNKSDQLCQVHIRTI